MRVHFKHIPLITKPQFKEIRNYLNLKLYRSENINLQYILQREIGSVSVRVSLKKINVGGDKN